MGRLLVDTARAVYTSLKRRGNELAATALLEEALRALRAVAADHWRYDGIADVPEMIKELAQDRDDFKALAANYRERLAKIESDFVERARQPSCNCCSGHEKWCDVYAIWRKEEGFDE